jgi:predicted nucleic acid-binding protein
LEWGLGRVESEVIAIALKNPGCEVVLDDRLGRKCAVSLSIRIKGTVGIVILAKRKGLITEARPLIQRLIDAGIYFSDKWLSEVLSIVNEKWL